MLGDVFASICKRITIQDYLANFNLLHWPIIFHPSLWSDLSLYSRCRKMNISLRQSYLVFNIVNKQRAYWLYGCAYGEFSLVGSIFVMSSHCKKVGSKANIIKPCPLNIVHLFISVASCH